MIHVADLQKESSFAPAQWIGEDKEGREVYIRYRNWNLTCSLDGDPRVSRDLEGEYDDPSRLSTEMMMHALSREVSFPDVVLP